MKRIAIMTALLLCIAAVRGEEKSVLVLHSMRLYLPDDALRDRLGNDVEPLSNYIKALHRAGVQSWKASAGGTAKGLFAAVGMRPDGSTRVWAEPVDGDVPADTLKKFSAALELVPAIPIKNGPVAFAIELGVGSELPETFPVIPQAWKDAAKESGTQLQIPDQMFEVIWPHTPR